MSVSSSIDGLAGRKMITGSHLQAVARHGGVRQVARTMGWRVVGKNPSPWYDLKSTREAFDAFAEKEGLLEKQLPNLDMLKRCSRRDMIKGAEEWGGLDELAELLDYKVCSVKESQCAWRTISFLQAGKSRNGLIAANPHISTTCSNNERLDACIHQVRMQSYTSFQVC